MFSLLTCPHGFMCIRMYIFCLKQKKKHTNKNKAKETKENRKTKETKRRKGERKCLCC